MKQLTKLQLITALIEDQIKRGIVSEERKEFHIRARRNDSRSDLQSYYNKYLKNN